MTDDSNTLIVESVPTGEMRSSTEQISKTITMPIRRYNELIKAEYALELIYQFASAGDYLSLAQKIALIMAKEDVSDA